MALVNEEILVLKSINFSEADKIINVFGKKRGRFGLIAKGIRKMESKNRGNMETMSLSKISYYEGRNIGILREAEGKFVPDFKIGVLNRMQKVIFLLYNLLPEDEEDLFVFNTIEDLYDSELSLRNINRFRVKILRHLGYLPDLKICGICSLEKELKYLQISDFHLICENCFEKSGEGEKRLLEPIANVRYESTKMTSAIDEYVKNIIEA